MQSVIELTGILHNSSRSDEERHVLFVRLRGAAERWKRNGKLADYLLMVAALDSNDEQVRLLAEELLHRSSPRPCECGRNQKAS